MQKPAINDDPGAVWTMDISQDDKVIALGSEDSYLVYYSLKKLIHTDEDNLEALTDAQQCKFIMGVWGGFIILMIIFE